MKGERKKEGGMESVMYEGSNGWKNRRERERELCGGILVNILNTTDTISM